METRIRLVKSAFCREAETKRALADFVAKAPFFSMGEQCRKFEIAFAEKQERKFAVFVSSGSSANLLLIQAYLNSGRLRKGDRVGFSALTWSTNVMPLIQLGLVPVPLDCRPETLNVPPSEVGKALGKIDALFLTNALGLCDDIAGIERICRERGILLFEDNCESLGSRAFGRLLGNFGHASTFSFFVGHHLSTIEGGMVCTDDEELYDLMLMARAHGWDRNLAPEKQERLRKESGIDDFHAKFAFHYPAFNVRPNEINGFLGLSQLPFWDEVVSRRESNFRLFQAAAAENGDILPLEASHMDLVSNFAYPLVFRSKEKAAECRERFAGEGVEIRPIIAGDMTRQPFFGKCCPGHPEMANAGLIHDNGFYFGNNPEMDDSDLGTIARLLAKRTAAGAVRKKKALITGITGQDGSYLAEILLGKGYEVHGLVRRTSSFNRERIEHLFIDPHVSKSDLHLHYGDLTDPYSMSRVIGSVRPDEIYNLAAQSHVRISFDMPEFTGNTIGLGTLRILECLREADWPVRFYQASSSEMFGRVTEIPQTEKTPFHPRSPYGCAKAYAYWLTVNYRESYGLFACNGILFNHESERRGENFVTRKIAIGLWAVKSGRLDRLYLGNLDARRDWGHAKDYAEGMWLMLQRESPDDYVLATGESHTVREFAEEAARHVGMDIAWEGHGLGEKGIDRRTGRTVIEIDPRYFRPAEVDQLVGDPAKARERLGWTARTSFKELVRIMMEAESKNIADYPSL